MELALALADRSHAESRVRRRRVRCEEEPTERVRAWRLERSLHPARRLDPMRLDVRRRQRDGVLSPRRARDELDVEARSPFARRDVHPFVGSEVDALHLFRAEARLPRSECLVRDDAQLHPSAQHEVRRGVVAERLRLLPPIWIGDVSQHDAVAEGMRVPRNFEPVLLARLLVEEERRDHQERVEPAAGLVDRFRDEVGRERARGTRSGPHGEIPTARRACCQSRTNRRSPRTPAPSFRRTNAAR